MIACVFAAAYRAVDTGRSETLRQWRTEQQMIDAQTGVATEGVPEIRGLARFGVLVAPLDQMSVEAIAG